MATSERNIWFAFENKDIYDAAGTLRYDGSTLRPANTDNNGHWRAFALIPPTNNAMFCDYNEGIFIPYYVGTPAASPEWYRDDVLYSAVWTPYAFEMDQVGANLAATGMTRPFYQIGDGMFFGDSQDQYNAVVTSATG